MDAVIDPATQINLNMAIKHIDDYLLTKLDSKPCTDLQKYQLAVKYLAMIRNPGHYSFMDRYSKEKTTKLNLSLIEIHKYNEQKELTTKQRVEVEEKVLERMKTLKLKKQNELLNRKDGDYEVNSDGELELKEKDKVGKELQKVLSEDSVAESETDDVPQTTLNGGAPTTKAAALKEEYKRFLSEQES